MSDVIMYTVNLCQYCVMAKRLFASKQVTYTELNIDEHSELREECCKKPNAALCLKSILAMFVGGFDDLHALDKAKNLMTY